MDLKHQILKSIYPIFFLRNRLFNKLKKNYREKVRILIYHDIPPEAQNSFSKQIEYLKKTWDFISPQKFIRSILGDDDVVRPSILLTFDDGFASNRVIVEKILNPLGIKALFFVISEFVALTPHDNWREFVSRHIWPGLKENEVPSHWHNMSWKDLEFLLDSGHTIGSHTAHHSRLSEVPEQELEAEIVLSAELLESKLGICVEHFAYTFGDLSSFSPAALALARQRFPFIYTGLRGNNRKGVPPWAIRRDAINPTDSHALVGAFLEGGADFHYTKALKTYESWGTH